MANILFVCSCNTFRSAVAEHVARASEDNLRHRHTFASAGTNVSGRELNHTLLGTMKLIDTPMDDHKARQVTNDILAQHDLVIAMGEEHQTYLMDEFGQTSHLFNTLCLGRRAGNLDTLPEIENLTRFEQNPQQYYIDVVTRIYCGMPRLFGVIPRLLHEGHFFPKANP